MLKQCGVEKTMKRFFIVTVFSPEAWLLHLCWTEPWRLRVPTAICQRKCARKRCWWCRPGRSGEAVVLESATQLRSCRMLQDVPRCSQSKGFRSVQRYLFFFFESIWKHLWNGLWDAPKRTRYARSKSACHGEPANFKEDILISSDIIGETGARQKVLNHLKTIEDHWQLTSIDY